MVKVTERKLVAPDRHQELADKAKDRMKVRAARKKFLEEQAGVETADTQPKSPSEMTVDELRAALTVKGFDAPKSWNKKHLLEKMEEPDPKTNEEVKAKLTELGVLVEDDWDRETMDAALERRNKSVADLTDEEALDEVAALGVEVAQDADRSAIDAAIEEARSAA